MVRGKIYPSFKGGGVYRTIPVEGFLGQAENGIRNVSTVGGKKKAP